MPQKLTLAHQTMFADLIQQCQDAAFDEQFPEGGTFVKHARREHEYWYYAPSQSDDPKRTRRYVGPADDPQITARVAAFQSLKIGYRERRSLVSSLRAAGLPAPNRMTGDVIEALWKAGFFRLRGVLVGTAAFQAYAGLLGVKLPSTALMTSDVDLAQFHSTSLLVDDSTPPMIEVLCAVDSTFQPVPHLGSQTRAASFVNAQGYKVEFLTPNRAGSGNQGRPAAMPALGGAGAEPLRYLDFLIYQPVSSALLHKGGVAVSIPAPERYAIHKLIVAILRRTDSNGYAKASKDLAQAGSLIEAMAANRRTEDIGFAWIEAWDRGARWQSRILAGARRLPDQPSSDLVAGIRLAAMADGKRPEDYGTTEIQRSGQQ